MLNLQIIRQFQAMSKGTEARDFNLIKGNFSYVQTWSMIQIAVVIICTIVQVRKQNLLSQKSQFYFLGSICEKTISRPQGPKERWKSQDEDMSLE